MRSRPWTLSGALFRPHWSLRLVGVYASATATELNTVEWRITLAVRFRGVTGVLKLRVQVHNTNSHLHHQPFSNIMEITSITVFIDIRIVIVYLEDEEVNGGGM